MSSILKALRRLEKEQAAGPKLRMRVVHGSAAAASRQPGNARTRIAAVLCCLVVLGIVAGWFYGKSHHPVTAPLAVKTEKPAPMLTAGPNSAPTPPNAAGSQTPQALSEDVHPHSMDTMANKPANPPAPASSERTGSPAAASPAGPAETSRAVIEGTAAMRTPDPARPHSAASPAPVVPVQSTPLFTPKPAVFPGKAAQPSPPSPLSGRAPEKTVKTTGTSDLPEATDLKIMAIAHSDIPEKRMAVIDGRIVHEGEGVAGYSVLRIDPDEILLKKGGKTYRAGIGAR